jgi:hypothetical protein
VVMVGVSELRVADGDSRSTRRERKHEGRGGEYVCVCVRVGRSKDGDRGEEVEAFMPDPSVPRGDH